MPAHTRSQLLRRRWLLPLLVIGMVLTQLPGLISAGYNNLGGLALNRAQIQTGLTLAETNAAYATAGQSFQQALRLAPDSARPYANLGTIYMDFDELEAAVLAYKEATRHTPDDRLAQYFYGQSLAATGNEATARAAWAAAQAAGVFVHQADALKSDDPEKALLNGERALAIAPNEPESVLVLGKVLTAQKQYTSAVALYQEAIARLPDEPDIYREAGRLLYRRLNRTAEAGELLEQAILLQPKDEAARLELARLYSGQGACYEAEAWVAQLLYHAAATHNEIQAYTIIGKCHLTQSRPRMAIPYLMAATGHETPSIGTLLLLAQAYESTGQPDDASRTYTRVLDLKPDNTAAQQALERLGNSEP